MNRTRINCVECKGNCELRTVLLDNKLPTDCIFGVGHAKWVRSFYATKIGLKGREFKIKMLEADTNPTRLAVLLGCSRYHIYGAISGKHRISHKFAKALCKQLDCEFDDICYILGERGEA